MGKGAGAGRFDALLCACVVCLPRPQPLMVAAFSLNVSVMHFCEVPTGAQVAACCLSLGCTTPLVTSHIWIVHPCSFEHTERLAGACDTVCCFAIGYWTDGDGRLCAAGTIGLCTGLIRPLLVLQVSKNVPAWPCSSSSIQCLLWQVLWALLIKADDACDGIACRPRPIRMALVRVS